MMQNNRWTPDIVVGIDFGMTCTGVAWSRGPAWPEPRALQHWPGRMVSELANKVPTMLQYEPKSMSVAGWGFLCDPDSEDPGFVECFKLHLDPSFQEDSRPDRPTTQRARKWYLDYLRGVHDYIAEVFSNDIPGWKIQKVEFVFSIPTTWKNPKMVAEMEQLLRSAGFGRDGIGHRANISLTEAEAAAVQASKQQYEKGDVVLVCDAGGGTTDVNVLRIMSAKTEPVSLKPLSWVDGLPIGSNQIDVAFHTLIISRLSLINHHLREDPATVATRMMRENGRFERLKCNYGTNYSQKVPTFPLRIPGLQEGLHHPGAMIENSSMIFSRNDIETIFDLQINNLLNLIDEQLDTVSQNEPGIQIVSLPKVYELVNILTTFRKSYLVLSGGLGSSAYLKKRFESYYTTWPGSSRAVENMKIVKVVEPQLAVVLGLVTEKIQSISLGKDVFTERCCRQSYGVVCSEEYKCDSPRHFGLSVRKDRLDGKLWVDGQIQWFIQQGQAVSVDGVIRPFTHIARHGDEFQPWQIQIVMSTLPRDKLPTNISQDGSRQLCKVSSILKTQEVGMKLKNRHWYNHGDKYWCFRFDIKAVIGAADLKFMLLTKEHKVINDEHDAIEIFWQAEVATTPTPGKTNPTRGHD